MDLLFPAAVAILLILFLITNFGLVAMLVNYALILCLIAVVAGAIAYGVYTALGPEISTLLAMVAVILLGLTRVGTSISGFIKGFVEGYRADPAKKA